MRAILIDPFKQTVTDIDIDPTLDNLYEILGVELITVVGMGDHALIIDDEGLLKPKDQMEYWWAAGAMQPFAGRGLILGNEYGENRAATIPLDFIRDRTRFVWPEEKETLNPEDYTGFGIVIGQ